MGNRISPNMDDYVVKLVFLAELDCSREYLVRTCAGDADFYATTVGDHDVSSIVVGDTFPARGHDI